MRFDMFRRRGAPPPSPLPPSAYRSSSPSSYTPSPSRWLSSDRPRTSAGSDHNASRSSSPSTSASSRAEFIAVLQARMELMEKVPTGSFSQSYAGEFDVSYSFRQALLRASRTKHVIAYLLYIFFSFLSTMRLSYLLLIFIISFSFCPYLCPALFVLPFSDAAR